MRDANTCSTQAFHFVAGEVNAMRKPGSIIQPVTAFEIWVRSPLSLVGNVETPTMMMVGEEDWRTPTWEAEQFYGALKLRQIDTVLVRVPESPHYIASRPSRLIAKTDNIMGWFRKYDPAVEQD